MSSSPSHRSSPAELADDLTVEHTRGGAPPPADTLPDCLAHLSAEQVEQGLVRLSVDLLLQDLLLS